MGIKDSSHNYTKNIEPGLQTPFIPKEYSSSWAQYSLLANSESERTKVMALLKESNIPSMVYYRLPLHLQKVFKFLEYSMGDFQVSESVASKIFSIPMHPYITRDQQDKVIEVLNNG